MADRGLRRTVLILGATGRVGGSALQALDGLGEGRPHIRVLVRRPENLPSTFPIEIFEGAIESEALEQAVRGADAILLVTGDDPRQPELEGRVIDAALRCGRPRIVKISAIMAGIQPRVSFGQSHGAVEDRLVASGLPYTILRPTFFFQSLALFAEPVRKSGRLIMPARQGAIAFVDMRDVGEAAVKVLVEDGHEGKAYDLSGARAWTVEEVARTISWISGQAVRYTSPPLPIARLMMVLAGGLSWWLSGQICELFAAIQKGAEAKVLPDLEKLLGRPPSSLEKYLAETQELWTKPEAGEMGRRVAQQS